MDLSFEHLQHKDIPAIKEVLEEESGQFDPEWVKTFISEKQNIALIAKLGDTSIGLIYGYSLTCIKARKPQFFIYSVDIFMSYQNKGYGTRFIKYAVDWAKDNGFSETFVLTHKDNPRACRAYEKAGMTHSKNDCERMYVAEYDALNNARRN